MKQVKYTGDQVTMLLGLLNSLEITGTANAHNITIMDQVIRAGKVEEVEEEKKEGD